MKKMNKAVIVILALVMALALGLSACGDGGDDKSGDKGGSTVSNPKVEITMEDGGKILLELDGETAPKTVANFVKLVDDGFYDGLTFHRIIPGFMIQGGDPEGTGMGGSKDTIEGEFSSNGVENNIGHEKGVISMARSGDPNSASSQFFIMNTDYPALDGQYAAFGHVISGIEEVDKISAVETDGNDYPLTPVKIKTIKVVE